MDALEQVYIMALFPHPKQLESAVQALGMPATRLVVLGGEASGASEVARRLDLKTELKKDVKLQGGQQDRIDYFLERQVPILAVQVGAADGRDVRLRLSQLGGESLDAPKLDVQANDVDVDPGMRPTDVPEMSPHDGRLSDNTSPTGSPDDA